MLSDISGSEKMHFVADLKKYFRYIILAAKFQLRSEVENSYLDWIWWILEPLCNMVVYTIIFGYVFDAKEDYFPVFIFIGISIWSFFNRTLNESVKLLKRHKSIITKVYIPKQILLIKSMLVNAFKMLLSFGIIVVMVFIYQIDISIYSLNVIPSLILLFLLTYGISCFLMHYGVYLEDLAYIVSILLKMAMYFTGIFYSIENKVPDPYGHLLTLYNPIAFLITTIRNSILYQTADKLIPLFIWLIVAIILAAMGTKLIYKNENSYVKVI